MRLAHILLSLEGRVSRRYVWFALIALTVAELLAAIGLQLFAFPAMNQAGDLGNRALEHWAESLALICLFLPIACAPVWAKRWHDLDVSGWASLLLLVPGLGLLVMFVTGFLRGTRGTNRFGPDPLG